MESKVMTPVKSIRAKCLDCCCGQAVEVRQCPCMDCSLWPYRLGHRPGKVELGGHKTEKLDSGV